MSMNMKVLLLLLSLSLMSCTQEERSFRVVLSVLGEEGDPIHLSEHSKGVPFITGEEGQQFTLVITPPHNKSYTYYSISYLPDKPLILEGYEESELSKEVNSGYVSEIRTVRGSISSYFVLHKGDPLGEYRVEVYINHQLSRAFTFNVMQVTQ